MRGALYGMSAHPPVDRSKTNPPNCLPDNRRVPRRCGTNCRRRRARPPAAPCALLSGLLGGNGPFLYRQARTRCRSIGSRLLRLVYHHQGSPNPYGDRFPAQSNGNFGGALFG